MFAGQNQVKKYHMYKKLKERKNINETTLKFGFFTSYAQIRFIRFVLKNFLQPRLQTLSKNQQMEERILLHRKAEKILLKTEQILKSILNKRNSK